MTNRITAALAAMTLITACQTFDDQEHTNSGSNPIGANPAQGPIQTYVDTKARHTVVSFMECVRKNVPPYTAQGALPEGTGLVLPLHNKNAMTGDAKIEASVDPNASSINLVVDTANRGWTNSTHFGISDRVTYRMNSETGWLTRDGFSVQNESPYIPKSAEKWSGYGRTGMMRIPHVLKNVDQCAAKAFGVNAVMVIPKPLRQQLNVRTQVAFSRLKN